jgi:argininosuccinate lyase
MSTLWQKGDASKNAKGDAAQIARFTVGQDREMDLLLAPFDVLGSIAHVRMLAQVGLLANDEAKALQAGLVGIYREIEAGKFRLEDNVEDVHSQVEFLLTKRLGDAGKKIHMARSRNDQVLVDIKMYLRSEIEKLVHDVRALFDTLADQAEKTQHVLMPGYTHLQLAMPSSFGLWFGAYAESLTDDLLTLHAAFEIADQNPLGSAAGFGSSFPINRTSTTEALGFAGLNYNVVYAQMGRGKSERVTAMALANVAETLARLSMDVCLFLNQNFSFLEFPDDLTTGSSIMPHKKNPDVFELIRSKCNRLKALPNEVLMMTTNLPSGYHRDLQLLKEHVFPAFSELRDCIAMARLMLARVRVKENLLDDPRYQYLYTVEEVNRLVLQGLAFRDAYKKVGEAVEAGTFQVTSKTLAHTHEGSIGNLGLGAVRFRMAERVAKFQFAKIHAAFTILLG